MDVWAGPHELAHADGVGTQMVTVVSARHDQAIIADISAIRWAQYHSGTQMGAQR
jgi:hypothetical protein